MGFFKIVLDSDFNNSTNKIIISKLFNSQYTDVIKLESDINAAYQASGAMLITSINIEQYSKDLKLVKRYTLAEFKERYLTK